MRISAIAVPLLLTCLLPTAVQSQSLPMMRSIEPAAGKGGDVLVIEGANLGQESVAALYVTDGQTDLKVTIVEQTATSIKFRIPVEAKPGRFALVVLTKDKPPRLIEEPVKITVEPQTEAFALPGFGNAAPKGRPCE
jgi:hypothetical protein